LTAAKLRKEEASKRSAALPARLGRERRRPAGWLLFVFGPEVGAHARLAIGVAVRPFDISVETDGEVALVT
jgi:hypothetical protein